jgi:hypothetical protein
MASTNALQVLTRLAVGILVPTMACFGYYTLDALDESRSAWAIPAVLAYPMALIGLIGLVSAVRAPRRSALGLWLWTLCLILPAGLLAWLRS